MKRSIMLIILTGIIGSLIYLSSIYLVKAELGLKRLAQKADDLEIVIDKPLQPEQQIPKTIPSSAILLPSEPIQEIKVTGKEQIQEEQPSGHSFISMDFENANLKDVLKIFCQQSGLNFIAGENVKLRPITLYLTNVKVQDALDAIIRANGLTYDQAEGSNVFIVRQSGDPELKLETKIFKLQYAFAGDTTIVGIDKEAKLMKGIKGPIQKILSPSGDLTVDERTNSLIITDIPSRFSLIEKSINTLDMQLPQILIEAKIVELTSSDIDQLGIKWTSLAGYTLRFQDPTRTYLSERWGSKDRSHVNEFGATDSWTRDTVFNNLTGLTTGDTITYQTAESDVSTETDTFANHLLKSDIRSAILSADDFELTLSLLLTDTNIDIISSPNIVTIHGKEAIITIGEEYPIPQFAYNQETGTFEVQGFDYKDIGIILRVIPYANKRDDNISMSIFPEVSSISGTVNFRGINIPIISTRQTRTNVAITNGNTLAIGGLLRDRDDTTITKVPVLGDLPILGRLFKHKEAIKTKTNLIIFITPTIISTSQPVTLSSAVSVPYSVSEGLNTQTSLTTHAVEDISTPVQKSSKTGTYQFTHR